MDNFEMRAFFRKYPIIVEESLTKKNLFEARCDYFPMMIVMGETDLEAHNNMEEKINEELDLLAIKPVV